MGKENQSAKQVIQSYLEERAKSDPLFATSYAKPNKNIDECYDYIIGEAKKRGGSVVCMSDDEVFGLAVHYYDEDDIKVSKQPATKAVVSNRPEKKKELIGTFKYGILPYIGLAMIVCGLIALEPNLSTATIIGALIVGMLIIGGMNLKWFIPIAGLGVSGIIFMIITTPWRITRMLTFLDPWEDIQGSGWQICQSLMALGSGGLLGRGFGEGKAKLLFMPEPQNDFIFAHIGEEMGLICGIILIAVYLFLIWRCIVIALNAPDPFSMLFSGGMAGLLGMQVFINIGVATALLPVTGMPLPFVSAGASSLISLMCGMGVVLNISKHCRI